MNSAGTALYKLMHYALRKLVTVIEMSFSATDEMSLAAEAGAADGFAGIPA
jgi:hypothetical protein